MSFLLGNLVGSILYILVKVKINESGADFISPLLCQEIAAYPPKMLSFSFLYKTIVVPWLSHNSWNFSLLLPSLVPLYNNQLFIQVYIN